MVIIKMNDIESIPIYDEERKPNLTFLKEILKISIQQVYMYDKDLINRGIQEQAISFKLAHYFQCLFDKYYKQLSGEYHIDCEYNKNCDGLKHIFSECEGCTKYSHPTCAIVTSQKEYKPRKEKEPVSLSRYVTDIKDKRDKYCRPDIVLHIRGGNKGNLISIEVKKGPIYSSNKDRYNQKIYDYMKLTYLTCKNSDYRYKLGYYIEFDKEKTKITEFSDGKKFKTYELCWEIR